ncbi:MAG: thioredoxin family protein [Victivallaceae bacterium]|nr:thioredoxin family protein [Victivallaceae bacterium]
MKKAAFVFLFALISIPALFAAVSPPAGWLTDVAAARERAQKENRPVLVLFSGTDWCPPCKALRHDLLDAPEFQAMIAQKCVALYIHVPVRADDRFSRTMKENFSFVRLEGVPTIIVTDPEIGKILEHVRRRSAAGFADALDAASRKLGK